MKNHSSDQPSRRHGYSSANQIIFFCRFTLLPFLLLVFNESSIAQSVKTVKPTGTGNTTGVIANLSVSNTTRERKTINEQTVYIPSEGMYQSYIAIIPETTIPPNGTTTIPINGYCADVNKPPVPSGTSMPPVTKWIPVQDPATVTGQGTINIIPRPPLKTFTQDDIPVITGSPAFTRYPDFPTTEQDIIIYWPDTDIVVKGIIDPIDHPEIVAPLYVAILSDIIDATEIILVGKNFRTPFFTTPVIERESVIQQTFWLVLSVLTGDEYRKEDFTAKVVEQFEARADTPLASFPEEQKESLQTGINDFWSTFQATGVEAKIISVDSPGLERRVRLNFENKKD